jgi:plastocyanin
VLVLGAALFGCGGSDGDEGAGTGAPVGADAATTPAACAPVGEDLQASVTETVPIELRDYGFSPSALEIAPGVVRFVATNRGTENHELAFLPGGGDVPLTPDGEPDEEALEAAGAFELEAFGPGEDCPPPTTSNPARTRRSAS